MSIPSLAEPIYTIEGKVIFILIVAVHPVTSNVCLTGKPKGKQKTFPFVPLSFRQTKLRARPPCTKPSAGQHNDPPEGI